MSGHSKWATTKHRKAAVDAKRGKLFAKVLRMVEVAAREGGGNLSANPTLADAVGRARDASIPNDTIDRAIKRGTGELEGVRYERLMYEGYAPGGVAVLLDVMTDNRNRTAADVRRIFTKNGGSLAEPGSVSWMFSKKGVILLPSSVPEDDLLTVATEAGAEDIHQEDGIWEVICDPADLGTVREAVETGGMTVESAQVLMQPSTTVSPDESEVGKVLKLLEELDDSDDVQEVYTNF